MSVFPTRNAAAAATMEVERAAGEAEGHGMARATWDEREQRILEMVADHEDEAGGRVERIDTVAEASGLDRRTTLLGLRALIAAGYVEAIDAGAEQQEEDFADYLEIGLLERGRRATGQWPAEDAVSDLLDLIRARVDAATDDEEKSRWQRLLDGAKGLSSKALQELTIAFLKHQAGLG